MTKSILAISVITMSALLAHSKDIVVHGMYPPVLDNSVVEMRADAYYEAKNPLCQEFNKISRSFHPNLKKNAVKVQVEPESGRFTFTVPDKLEDPSNCNITLVQLHFAPVVSVHEELTGGIFLNTPRNSYRNAGDLPEIPAKSHSVCSVSEAARSGVFCARPSESNPTQRFFRISKEHSDSALPDFEYDFLTTNQAYISPEK